MLAVALKRRVSLFHLDGSQLVALRDFALPDPPSLVAWCGTHICVASTKHEYVCFCVGGGDLVGEMCGDVPPCVVQTKGYCFRD